MDHPLSSAGRQFSLFSTITLRLWVLKTAYENSISPNCSDAASDGYGLFHQMLRQATDPRSALSLDLNTIGNNYLFESDVLMTSGNMNTFSFYHNQPHS